MTAAVVELKTAPGIAERYFSLWLDMSGPSTATRNGYEARVTALAAANSYSVTLARWANGFRSVLATSPTITYAPGASIALVDEGSTLSAWGISGTNAVQLLSGYDSSYASGYAGLEAAGNYTRLANFKAGTF
jgi:hypothetical protein